MQDAEWGELEVSFASRDGHVSEDFSEYFLSFGLGYLHHVITAMTHDERYRITDSGINQDHLYYTAQAINPRPKHLERPYWEEEINSGPERLFRNL